MTKNQFLHQKKVYSYQKCNCLPEKNPGFLYWNYSFFHVSAHCAKVHTQKHNNHIFFLHIILTTILFWPTVVPKLFGLDSVLRKFCGLFSCVLGIRLEVNIFTWNRYIYIPINKALKPIFLLILLEIFQNYNCKVINQKYVYVYVWLVTVICIFIISFFMEIMEKQK